MYGMFSRNITNEGRNTVSYTNESFTSFPDTCIYEMTQHTRIYYTKTSDAIQSELLIAFVK
jgi:hypothetical protein